MFVSLCECMGYTSTMGMVLWLLRLLGLLRQVQCWLVSVSTRRVLIVSYICDIYSHRRAAGSNQRPASGYMFLIAMLGLYRLVPMNGLFRRFNVESAKLLRLQFHMAKSEQLDLNFPCSWILVLHTWTHLCWCYWWIVYQQLSFCWLVPSPSLTVHQACALCAMPHDAWLHVTARVVLLFFLTRESWKIGGRNICWHAWSTLPRRDIPLTHKLAFGLRGSNPKKFVNCVCVCGLWLIVLLKTANNTWRDMRYDKQRLGGKYQDNPNRNKVVSRLSRIKEWGIKMKIDFRHRICFIVKDG